MKAATALVKDIREELRDIDDRLRAHPYPGAIERGEITLEGLKAFPGHQHHVVLSDMRSMAMMLQRFADTPFRDFWSGVLQGELAAPAGVAAMGQKLGMTRDDLDRYEVTAEGFAYATQMAWAAANASAAEIACALLINFPAWGFSCGRMGKALRDRYGFGPEHTAFLDAFANLPSFEDTAVAIVQDGLDRGVEPRAIRRTTRLFQAYEKMFWDAMLALGARQASG
ncbi:MULTISPECIES: hypothetical protein [Sorangium]|uniref:Thiaminase-2/PQQC domain-containing protein n=1 Tax=Sorangium cellulosum TaxID=56 RepID=A0A4P2QXH5_SORCE|nr:MULTISPECIES: hypothetical protein [Sorangium]AUX34938.1 uncharacterized protein SOCE836_071180 [Sorangium cellulosum]WCQ94245.1 hypothetical protein NQZ70_07002 [Sorangium sp. Soce836]